MSGWLRGVRYVVANPFSESLSLQDKRQNFLLILRGSSVRFAQAAYAVFTELTGAKKL